MALAILACMKRATQLRCTEREQPEGGVRWSSAQLHYCSMFARREHLCGNDSGQALAHSRRTAHGHSGPSSQATASPLGRRAHRTATLVAARKVRLQKRIKS